MRRKPKIFRRPDGTWAVRRPLVGFRPGPDESAHASWSDALSSLAVPPDHDVAGGQFERDFRRTDQLGPVPGWTPLEYDQQEDGMTSSSDRDY